MDENMTENEIEKQINVWREFARRRKIIKLNTDMEKVRSLAKGVLNNENMRGLKFCPCRVRTKDFEKDLKLVCPCNFLSQKTWLEKGECWCGLFVKS